MKQLLLLLLWTLAFPLFFSCSEDNLQQSSSSFHDEQSELFKKFNILPENKNNAYDAAGRLHNELCEAFIQNDLTTNSIAETIGIVESLSLVNTSFVAVKPISYQPPTVAQISSIFNSADLKATGIIQKSKMTGKAKSSLETFLESLTIHANQNSEFDSIYIFIFDYEALVAADSLLTANDKQIILTTTSISRHAYYFASKRKKKPRDRDWDINWTGIIAGTLGAEDNMARAITTSVAVAITLNQ